MLSIPFSASAMSEKAQISKEKEREVCEFYVGLVPAAWVLTEWRKGECCSKC